MKESKRDDEWRMSDALWEHIEPLLPPLYVRRKFANGPVDQRTGYHVETSRTQLPVIAMTVLVQLGFSLIHRSEPDPLTSPMMCKPSAN
jgi:hypothetical protein